MRLDVDQPGLDFGDPVRIVGALGLAMCALRGPLQAFPPPTSTSGASW